MGAYGDDAPNKWEPLKKCYREPGEPRDERPVIYRRPFWRSVEEESAYLSAVRNNAREVDLAADTIENLVAYIRRLASIAEKAILAPPLKAMPRRAPVVTEGGLSFEDRCDGIYDREPGQEG